MRLIIEREGICNHAVNTCERCLGILIERPMGVDRPCIIEQVDDGSPILTLIIRRADGQEKAFALPPYLQQLVISEGWQEILDQIDELALD